MPLQQRVLCLAVCSEMMTVGLPSQAGTSGQIVSPAEMAFGRWKAGTRQAGGSSMISTTILHGV